jgi:hypothetical protein
MVRRSTAAPCGPGVAAQQQPLPRLNIEDVAPTALYLMGLPIPSDMDGRVLAEILEPATVAHQPLGVSGPMAFWPEEDAASFSEEVMSAEDEEVIRDRLRALGYFE